MYLGLNSNLYAKKELTERAWLDMLNITNIKKIKYGGKIAPRNNSVRYRRP
jgi:hypothetical protein